MRKKREKTEKKRGKWIKGRGAGEAADAGLNRGMRS